MRGECVTILWLNWFPGQDFFIFIYEIVFRKYLFVAQVQEPEIILL